MNEQEKRLLLKVFELEATVAQMKANQWRDNPNQMSINDVASAHSSPDYETGFQNGYATGLQMAAKWIRELKGE